MHGDLWLALALAAVWFGDLGLKVNAEKPPPEAAGPGVEVRVRDTGRGIPPELVDRIFDTFFSTKAVGKGTGLGLALSRRIVESAGGKIEVETTRGVGTTMRVWLPAVEPGRLEEP